MALSCLECQLCAIMESMEGRKSIFELENRITDPSFEMSRLYSNFLSRERIIAKGYSEYIFVEELNEKIFPTWPYRDTFITVDEYLKFIGVTDSTFSKEAFFYFLEFVSNISSYALKKMGYRLCDPVLKACIVNVPRILEKMNCKFKQEGDKYIIIKKNSDIDSIVQYVPETIADLLLNYGDFRIEKDVKAKQTILKKIDLYVEKNKKALRGHDDGLYQRIQQIVNKLGINHPIESPYDELNKNELLEKYDECFTMMTHLLRYDAVKQIEEKNKKFFLENKLEKS